MAKVVAVLHNSLDHIVPGTGTPWCSLGAAVELQSKEAKSEKHSASDSYHLKFDLCHAL